MKGCVGNAFSQSDLAQNTYSTKMIERKRSNTIPVMRKGTDQGTAFSGEGYVFRDDVELLVNLNRQVFEWTPLLKFQKKCIFTCA